VLVKDFLTAPRLFDNFLLPLSPQALDEVRELQELPLKLKPVLMSGHIPGDPFIPPDNTTNSALKTFSLISPLLGYGNQSVHLESNSLVGWS
jgi:hypothetical protein